VSLRLYQTSRNFHVGDLFELLFLLLKLYNMTAGRRTGSANIVATSEVLFVPSLKPVKRWVKKPKNLAHKSSFRWELLLLIC